MLKLKLPYVRQGDGTYNVTIGTHRFILMNGKPQAYYDFRRYGVLPGNTSSEVVHQFLLNIEPDPAGRYQILHGFYDKSVTLLKFVHFVSADDILQSGGLQKTFERMMEEDT